MLPAAAEMSSLTAASKGQKNNMPTGVPLAEGWEDREPPRSPPTAAVTGSDSVARFRAGPGSDMLVDLIY